MSDEQLALRERAERRVHERYERERERLREDLKAERRELIRRHREKLERLDVLQVRLTERKLEAEAAHALAWRQEEARLSSRMSSAPGFGLLGPPRRNLQNEYNERRERWEAQYEAIKERFDQQLRLITQERRDLRETHAQQASWYRHKEFQSLAELERGQSRTFEAAVSRELSRGERGATREFAKHAGRERER